MKRSPPPRKARLLRARRCSWPRVRWLRSILLAAACLAGVAPVAALAQAPAYKEYELKAVFLFNFAQFVDWPSSAFAAADAPLVIGVVGQDPFGDYLDATVRGEKVNNHPLVVRRYHRVEDVTDCHILFVGPTEQSRLDQVLTRLKGRPILTVGDTANFARRGGMIQFFTENNKIRLLINTNAATTAGLTLSSKLLRAAEVLSAGGG